MPLKHSLPFNNDPLWEPGLPAMAVYQAPNSLQEYRYRRQASSHRDLLHPQTREMDLMHLHVVRHGETWANAEHRYLGALDPELTERGREQALSLSQKLPASIDALIVSPRLRAQQTAQILNQALRLEPVTMDSFRERDVGVFEGLTQAQAQAQYPQLWAQNITRQWAVGPTGGESIAEVVARVHQGLTELAARHPSGTVLLVAHGFVAKVIRGLARGDFSDFYDWQLPNGERLVLENFHPMALPTGALL
ncbi:histidine phosphatase family protein [Pseudomonas sp. 18.1.10]|uniref:histidine phosphatase family protein n=1 Tax=Pseudomonas sp. 18.1.10 TaxID=2969302 RepID=UPI00214FD044|nr:histidine phosphatase family protein [Pseudomonas sp. 18.1.10]MCR4541313.1 histidine phosphatase family protein [Pseudomonas sp. 18.1.10]